MSCRSGVCLENLALVKQSIVVYVINVQQRFTHANRNVAGFYNQRPHIIDMPAVFTPRGPFVGDNSGPSNPS